MQYKGVNFSKSAMDFVKSHPEELDRMKRYIDSLPAGDLLGAYVSYGDEAGKLLFFLD